MYINSNGKADTLRRNMKENESMKKWIALTLALVLALSLFAGCGKSADADETDYASMSIEELKPLLKTVTDGKLTVATSPDFAPYEFYSIDENENPTLVGFDIALAQYIAVYLGLELEIIPMDFDGTLSELSAKKVDLALSGYSPDPTREEAAFAIRNNICRCTGYVKIIDAILLAAELFRKGEVPPAGKWAAASTGWTWRKRSWAMASIRMMCMWTGCATAAQCAASTPGPGSCPSTPARRRPCPAWCAF